MENYYSLSDIKSIMGDEGMGGGWFLIVILFLFLFGFGGMGFNRNCGPGNCGGDGYVTTSLRARTTSELSTTPTA